MDRVERWERATEIPLAVVAVVFLAAYAVPILTWPGTSPVLARACELVVWLTWPSSSSTTRSG